VSTVKILSAVFKATLLSNLTKPEQAHELRNDQLSCVVPTSVKAEVGVHFSCV
jgi:hypothetical protein